MTFPWEVLCDPDPLGTPAFLRRDTDNRAPFMGVVAAKPQPQGCTEPPPVPWSALPTTENTNHETTTDGFFGAAGA